MESQNDETPRVVSHPAAADWLAGARTETVGAQLSRNSVMASAALVTAVIALLGVIVLGVLMYSRARTQSAAPILAETSSPAPATDSGQTALAPLPTGIGTPAGKGSSGPQSSERTRQEETTITDMAIQRELNLKLLDDPELEMHPLDATVDHARVVLRGQLPSARLRSRAESIVKGVRGVRGVVNQINVNAAAG